MNWPAATTAFLLVTAVTVIAWTSVMCFFNEARGDTVSAVMLKHGTQFWTIPFVFGVLGGHLFMPSGPLGGVKWWGLLLLVGLGIAVGAAGWLMRRLPQSRKLVAARAFGLLLLGIVAGHVFWPQ